MTSQPLVSNQTTAQAQNPATQAPSNPAVGGNGFQWGQSGSGSTSLAYGCIMEVMALMTQIQSMNAQQAGNSVTVAGEAARNSYNSNMTAAEKNQEATRLDAASSFISGGLGLVGVAANSAMTSDSNLKLSEQGKESTELNSLSGQLSERKAKDPDLIAGSTPEAAEATRKDKMSPQAYNRVKELTTSPTEVRSSATENQRAVNKEAIANMTDSEVKEFSEKLTVAQENNSRDINNAYSHITSTHNSVDAWKGIVTSTSTGIIDIFKGQDTQAASQAQAMGQLESSQSQQMYAMYNNQAGQMTQNGQKGLEALQLLAQLAQASSFRG